MAALPQALATWEETPPTRYNKKPATYRGAGLGFVFTADDPYMLVDLDKSVEQATGTLKPWARAIVETLHSYTQRSVSRTGLGILVQASVPTADKQHGDVQMWHEQRFVAMTGWHVDGTPRTIEPRQSQLTQVHAAHILLPKLAAAQAKAKAPPPARTRTAPASGPPRLTDQEILTLCSRATNGAKFHRLWAGDPTLWEGDGAPYQSQSEVDEALLCLLAFYTRDAAQLESLFRQSDLCDAKWTTRPRYQEQTIAKALALVTEHYDPVAYAAAQAAAKGRNGDTPGPADQEPPAADTRPVIRLGPDITRMVDEGQAALLTLPDGPLVFQRARRLSMIARGITSPKYLHRPADAPVIVEAQAAYPDELATRAARWEKFDKRAKKGEEWVEVTPPSRFVQTLQARPSWPFPLLEGLIHSPTLRPDGSLLDTPGYDREPDSILTGTARASPRSPARPTLDDARSALGRLQEVVRDFPFARDYHFSAWISAVLSLVCRATIAGCVPLHGITATTRGSGKTLLADTIALIGTGRLAARWSQVFDEDEERKRMLALALDGDPLVCIDNISAPLGSGVLALALTGSSFKDRLLGVSETREAPLSAVFLCTGNNVQYVGDVARRVVPIAIDPIMERPEERTGFAHPSLLPWVHAERPRLTMAALTIVKAYFEAGCPAQGLTPFGSFEAWSDLIRQALVWAGGRTPMTAARRSKPRAIRSSRCWRSCSMPGMRAIRRSPSRWPR